MTQPEYERAERGYYATLAAVGGDLDQIPSDTVSLADRFATTDAIEVARVGLMG